MELVIKLFLGDTRITQGIKWWNSGCSTRCKTWTTPSKIPFPLRKNMVGQSGRGSMAFQNISYIMSVSPQNTGYTKPAWDTHSNLTLTEKKKKNLVTCHFESVSGALPKKRDERAALKEQERVYAPDGEIVPVYIRAPKLSYKVVFGFCWIYPWHLTSSEAGRLASHKSSLVPCSQAVYLFLD